MAFKSQCDALKFMFNNKKSCQSSFRASSCCIIVCLLVAFHCQYNCFVWILFLLFYCFKFLDIDIPHNQTELRTEEIGFYTFTQNLHFNYSIAVKYLFLGWLVFLLRCWNHTVGGNNLSSLQTRASCLLHDLVFLCSVVSVKPEGSAAEDKCKNIIAVEQRSAKVNPFFLSVSGFVKELVINQFLISVCLKNKIKYGHIRKCSLMSKSKMRKLSSVCFAAASKPQTSSASFQPLHVLCWEPCGKL